MSCRAVTNAYVEGTVGREENVTVLCLSGQWRCGSGCLEFYKSLGQSSIDLLLKWVL